MIVLTRKILMSSAVASGQCESMSRNSASGGMCPPRCMATVGLGEDRCMSITRP